jgi:ornithine cyclodeaminase
MKQAIDAMESAFIQLANHQVELPLRTGIAIKDENALSLSMPGYLGQDKTLGLKVVSIFPNNLVKNKPSINGFIMLLDSSTGEPMALMDAGFLTALRTGAVSGLATRYFSREDAKHVAIIGAGVQAHTQLEAVAAVRDIKRVSVWSRNWDNAVAFAKKWETQFDCQVGSTILEAVSEADIICTATGSGEPLIHRFDIQDHAHINAIGSHSIAMREISHEVLAEAVVFADQREAVLAESGEIINAIAENHLKKEDIIEIGQWLLDKQGDFKQRLTVFKSVGLAIQDLSVARIVYQNAVAQNFGLDFNLD